MKRIARKNAVALAATIVSCTLLASLPAQAGSAVADGTDFVVTAAAGETYTVDTAIGNYYARLVKRGAGEAVLTAVSAEFAGTAVVEEGTLSITRLRALGDTAPVVVASGATFYLKTPHGSSFAAHALTIAGDGVDGKGAFRFLPSSGSGSDDGLLGVVNLSGNATIECDYSWGVGTINLGGHRLRRICNDTSNSRWMLIDTTVSGPGTVEACGGRISFHGDVNTAATVAYVVTNASAVTLSETKRDIPSAFTFFPDTRAVAESDVNHISGPIHLSNHAGATKTGYVTFETSAPRTLYLDGPITTDGNMAYNTSGNGNLVLNGSVSVSKWVYVNSGTQLAMTSTASRVYAGGLGANGKFNANGGSSAWVGGGHTLFYRLRAGSDANTQGAFRQTGGILGVTESTAVGVAATSVGHWSMSGGEAYVSNTVHVAESAGSFGSFVQTDGLFKLGGGSQSAVSAGCAGSAVFHVRGGTNDTCITQGAQTPRFTVGDAGGTSDVTVSGEGTLLATETLRLGGDGAVSTNVFTVKDGATVKATRFFKHRSADAASLVTVNADGGTLMPTFGYDWTGVGQTDPNYYKGNPDHFVVWSNGLVIDTSESTGNNPASHMPFSFASPSGKGVASIALPAEGDYTNAVYIGPARIVFEDETGWGASAYAEYDYDAKKHTRVVLTSRGCGYGDNAKAYVESPDRTTRYECALVLSDNAGLGGELIKRGTHDLHLYAANTTTGGIAVESGTLCAETAGVVPSGTPVRVEHGATLLLPDDTPITVSTFAGSGALKAATGGGIAVTVTNAVRAKCADLFAGRFEAFPDRLTFAPGATFTITDPENLATYSHNPAATAFTASSVGGAPRLAFEGEVPPGSGTWSFFRKNDGEYRFGPVVGTIVLIR